MRALRIGRWVAVGAAALLLAGCGTADSASVPGHLTATDPPPDRDLPMAEAGPALTCGGLTFAALTLRTGGGEIADLAEPVTEALEDLVRRHPMDRPAGLPERDVSLDDWMLLATEGERGTRRVEIATGEWGEDGPGARAMTVSLEERSDATLKVVGWGECRSLAPVLEPGHSWVEVYAAEGAFDPASTALPVRVTERQCASARHPDRFLHEPTVVETAESVTISWTSDDVFSSVPPGVAVTCPGNPVVRRTVELAEPLGDRVVLDGSYWPAREVGAPD